MAEDEKELEKRLCEKLRCSNGDRSSLKSLVFAETTSQARSVADLVGPCDYDLIEDDSRWNSAPRLMQDVAGGMIPDVVLRSRGSGENRIYIEVKKTQPLGRGRADSQVVRYFLHLLGTTHRDPIPGAQEILRAVIVAAPEEWFANRTNADTWSYFLNTFAPLATSFGITLAALHLRDSSSSSNRPMQPTGSAGG
jgi:hypothetical protein